MGMQFVGRGPRSRERSGQGLLYFWWPTRINGLPHVETGVERSLKPRHFSHAFNPNWMDSRSWAKVKLRFLHCRSSSLDISTTDNLPSGSGSDHCGPFGWRMICKTLQQRSTSAWLLLNACGLYRGLHLRQAPRHPFSQSSIGDRHSSSSL